jgi:hypothetical protein
MSPAQEPETRLHEFTMALARVSFAAAVGSSTRKHEKEARKLVKQMKKEGDQYASFAEQKLEGKLRELGG